MRLPILIVAAALFTLGVNAAQADNMSVPATAGDSKIGKVLADGKMMTLYTFDKDQPGKSNCNGMCADNWPPLMAPADAKANGDWSIVARDDGTKQWAYKGHPLYGWVKDQKPGDTTGDGIGTVWHAAKP
jgi:predicted lipoprotein with Yx(FWY)xxD motif